jgi:long-chain acyl-CoA synthetase
MLLPGVRECGCVGSPDERSGEAVNLFVVAEPGAGLSADDVRRHCREHLSAYKVPRRVEFIEALPKTPVGKILKRELRALL